MIECPDCNEVNNLHLLYYEEDDQALLLEWICHECGIKFPSQIEWETLELLDTLPDH